MNTVVFGAVCGALMLLAFRKKTSKRQPILEQLKKLLGGTHNTLDSASGDALGARASLRFTSEGTGRYVSHWTVIQVDLPPEHPFALVLRRRKRGRAIGTAVEAAAESIAKVVDLATGGSYPGPRLDDLDLPELDLQLEDREFHRAYRTSAAPAAVARIVLDAGLRAYLSSLGNVELTTHRADYGGVGVPYARITLQMSVCRWLEDLVSAREALEAAVGIATGLAAAYQQVARADRAAVSPGVPFRPELSGPAAQDAASARADEVARLEKALASVRR